MFPAITAIARNRLVRMFPDSAWDRSRVAAMRRSLNKSENKNLMPRHAEAEF